MLKDNPSLKVFNSPEMLAKAYVDTKAMVGKKVTAPTDASTPEEIAAWRKLVGAPNDPTEYGDLKPKDIPDELWDAGLSDKAKAIALKYHLPAAALKEFAALNIEGTKAAYDRETAKAAAAMEEGKMQLRKEWGEHFERNRARALTVAAALGIPEGDDLLMRSDILMKFAAAAPSLLGGDAIVSGAPVGISGGIQAQIEAVRSSPEYQGHRGEQPQRQAQARLHALMTAQKTAKSAA